VIDAASKLCAGCGRTLAEIGGWLRYTDGERRAIMAALPQRLVAARMDRMSALVEEAAR
jgi:uncharacterized protein